MRARVTWGASGDGEPCNAALRRQDAGWASVQPEAGARQAPLPEPWGVVDRTKDRGREGAGTRCIEAKDGAQ
jgi:hypothetical protein